MDGPLSVILLTELSEFVSAQMGLSFPKERWHDLVRGIDSAAREFGFKDLESCVQWLASSPLTRGQIEILAGHLTIGETYFFREKRSFEILEGHILPKLIRSRRGIEKRLRIWSAGSCTGEEPYSIAISISKMIPDLKDWNITILATDINPRFLEKAHEGLYGEWSFRDTPSWIKERYFKKGRDGRLEILPDIKKMVTFSYLNLAEDAYPSLLNNTNAMDLIFCRNVLIYFTQERAKRVIQNLYRCLVDGGWLVVSPSETSQVLFSKFTAINFSDLILYRKVLSPETRVPDFGLKEPYFKPELETLDSELKPSLNLEPQIPEPQFEPLPLQSVEEQPPYMDALGLYEQGRYEEAAEKIIKLSSRDQTDSKAISLLSRAYANQGRLAEALTWCEKAIAQDKINPSLHYLRATILQEQGAIDEAIRSLKRALYLDQDFVLAHFALGNLAMRQGRIKESERHLKNALMLLRNYQQEEILPESDGIIAGRLSEIIVSMTHREKVA